VTRAECIDLYELQLIEDMSAVVQARPKEER
jgi:hypothetical protein